MHGRCGRGARCSRCGLQHKHCRACAKACRTIHAGGGVLWQPERVLRAAAHLRGFFAEPLGLDASKQTSEKRRTGPRERSEEGR